MKSRDRTLRPYDVLGVPPASEPEHIEAAYRSLIRKYGGRDGDAEKMSKIEAAFEQLKDPLRRREHDAGASGAATPFIGAAMWQVKPRTATPASSFAPVESADPREAATGAASPSKMGPIAPPEEPAASEDAALGISNNPVIGSAPRHRIITDDDDQSPASTGEPAQAIEEPIAADPLPRAVIDWSRVVPVAGVIAIVVIASGAQLLIDRSPDDANGAVRRESPATASPTPIAAPPPSETSQSTGDGQQTQLAATKPATAPVNQADGGLASSEDQREISPVAAPSRIAPEGAPQPAASTKPLSAKQPASPAPAKPVAANSAPPKAAQPVAANPPQSAGGSLAAVTPARWISGGLQDSDNKKGRYEGAVGVRVVVRPDGRAGGCRVTQSSGDPGLDEATCRLVTPRLLFSPARNAAGQAMQSEVATTYVWGRRVRR